MSVHVNWIGHACFKLVSPELTIIIDPTDRETGYNPPRTSADVVLVSSEDPHHSFVESIKDTPIIFDGPGEYEVKGSLIHGIESSCKNHALPNTIFTFTMEGIRFCHLGTLGERLTDAQISQIGNIDVLMVPVGVPSCLTLKAALEAVHDIDPRMVVPYGFKTKKSTLKDVEDPKEFLKEMGLTGSKPDSKIVLKAKQLPSDETETVYLSAQG